MVSADNVMGLDSCAEMELGSNCDQINFTSHYRLGTTGYSNDCRRIKARGKFLSVPFMLACSVFACYPQLIQHKAINPFGLIVSSSDSRRQLYGGLYAIAK